MKINTTKIEKYRKRAQMTMAAFAKLIGIQTSTYFYIIKKATTKFKTVDKIAKVMDVESKDLLI